MSATDLEIGQTLVRPKSLSASLLLRRAILGAMLLAGFTMLSAWLYDAGIASERGASATPIAPTVTGTTATGTTAAAPR